MNLNKPKPFTPNKNQLAHDWLVWKEEFLVYLKLSNGYPQFSEEQRALLLINFMGTEAIKAMEQIHFENVNDKKDMDILLIKFDEFFNPSLNEVEERYKFFSRRKSPNEDLDKYLLDLKEKAAKCNFGNQCEKFIIDMLVLSMDTHLRELIWASKLETLPDVIYNYKQYNMNHKKIKGIAETTKKNLNPENLENAKSYNDEPSRKYYPVTRVCSKCGTNHPYKQCPAFHNICQTCFLKGHYTGMCKQSELLNKAKSFSEDENKKMKPATSKLKQNQAHGTKVDTLQHCLWCYSHHLPGKCHHDSMCTSCNNFPHIICFQCKKNPHEHNCYYKSIITLPIIQNTGDAQPNQIKTCTKCGCKHENYAPCKFCGSCQVYGHWINECPRKSNKLNNRAQPTVNDLVDGFVEIGNAFRSRAQPERQEPTPGPWQANPNQHKQNNRPNSNRNKKEKSDACCIS